MENSNSHLEQSSQALLNQDRAALFSSQFATLRVELYAFLLSRIGADVSSAEDCLQEIAIVLWNKHQSDWTAEDYRRYAFRCANIEAKAYHRKNRRTQKHITYLSPDMVTALSTEVMKCEREDAALSMQRTAALKQCMDQLNPKDKEILDARYDKQGRRFTINDLAAHQNCKTTAIYKRLERLRSSLHQCISKRINRHHHND